MNASIEAVPRLGVRPMIGLATEVRVRQLVERADELVRQASRLREQAQGLLIRDWLLRRS